jgi:hypothetical protein
LPFDLNALRVPLVAGLARAGRAALGALPALAAALSPKSRAAGARSVGGLRGGLRRSRGLTLGGRRRRLSRALADGDGSRAAAEVALGGHDLVVVVAQGHALGGPGVKVGGDVDGAAGTLVAADGPVLLEGRRAVDRGLVGAGADGNVVGAAVDGDLALLLGVGRGVEGAKVLDNVVLDEGVAGPAVDGEVAVAVVGVGTRVLDDTAEGTDVLV